MSTNLSLFELQEIERRLLISLNGSRDTLKRNFNIGLCFYEEGKLILGIGFHLIDFEKFALQEKLSAKTKEELKIIIDDYLKAWQRLNYVRKVIIKIVYGNDKSIKEHKRGNLKQFVVEQAEKYNLIKGETVPVKICGAILKAAQKEKLTKSNKIESIRKGLQRLGYGQERMLSIKNKQEKFPSQLSYNKPKNVLPQNYY